MLGCSIVLNPIFLNTVERPVGILGEWNAQHHAPSVRVARRDKTSVLAFPNSGRSRSAVGLSRTEQAALHFASLR